MAISSYKSYLDKLASPHASIVNQQGIANQNYTTNYRSRWAGEASGNQSFPSKAATPTTAVICDRSTPGSLLQPNAATAMRLGAIFASGLGANGDMSPGGVLIIDRLSHQGGLDSTVTSAQTTNLPTAALTRYTNGIGVQAAVEIRTISGAAGTCDITGSYTNSGGVSGRTFEASLFPDSSSRPCFKILPWQAGDAGVKSVESITLSASLGGTPTFGVVLFMPLYFCPMGFGSKRSVAHNRLWQMREILPDACIQILQFNEAQDVGSTNPSAFNLFLITD